MPYRRGARFQWLVVCMAVIMVPILAGTLVPAQDGSGQFPGWDDEWDGVSLKRLDFTWRERSFVEGFPGQAAYFSDGRRQLIMRYTERVTRKMLSAEDCFREAGFEVSSLDDSKDASGRTWSRFEAKKFGESFLISERVTDRRGREWTQVSSWYWSATLGWSGGPWWAVTIVEPAGKR
jgi:hypothetical protein